jgi:hypothetical protein
MAEVTFKTASGGDPAEYIIRLANGAKPTEGDALYAAQRQKTRMVERTLRGVDVNERAFEPYSTNGPVYYYPLGRVGRTKATAKQKKAAVRGLLKRTAGVTAIRSEYGGYMGVGGVKTRSGTGIRYESYADFKASLGRAGVDLTGPRAPHMLQAIGVRAGNRGFASIGDETVAGKSTPVTEFAIGVYGEAAGRASGHNTGFSPRWKRRHQRYFFGASAADLQAMASDIWTRIKVRLTGKL